MRSKRWTSATVLAVILLQIIPNSNVSHAVDFTDSTAPTYGVEEISGVDQRLNLVLFKIQAFDSSNEISLKDCRNGPPPAFCDPIGGTLSQSDLQIPPTNIAPACASNKYGQQSLGIYQISSNSQRISDKSNNGYLSMFYLAVTKNTFTKLPDGCPNWRDEAKPFVYSDKLAKTKLTVVDSAGNSTRILLDPFLNNLNMQSNSEERLCFIDSDLKKLVTFLRKFANTYISFQSRVRQNPLFVDFLENQDLQAFSERVSHALQYADFFEGNFELVKLNLLPLCTSWSESSSSVVVGWQAEMIFLIADLTSRMREIENIENVKKAEAHAKAAAELKAKEEADAKAAAELKAKEEADAKAAAELKAKEEADAKAAADALAAQKPVALKKTTITCVKRKLTKKVTAVNPKCPTGYKKK